MKKIRTGITVNGIKHVMSLNLCDDIYDTFEKTGVLQTVRNTQRDLLKEDIAKQELEQKLIDDLKRKNVVKGKTQLSDSPRARLSKHHNIIGKK